jgi:molybdopterin-binding protein
MPLSARNHLKGEITEVLLGTVTALITVRWVTIWWSR